MSPIHYHSKRATDERLNATDASDAGFAAIHVELAQMHEQLVAVDINDGLAPLDGLTRLERVYRA